MKPLLEADEQFQRFNADCNRATAQIQQTELYFLKPPTQRSKARDPPIGARIEWAVNMLHYQDQGDFSLIDPAYQVTPPALNPLIDVFGEEDWPTLCSLLAQSYPTVEVFDEAAQATISRACWEAHQGPLHTLASLGRQRFDEKFNWLNQYRDELEGWQQRVEVIERAETPLKHDGLHPDSTTEFQRALAGKDLHEPARSN